MNSLLNVDRASVKKAVAAKPASRQYIMMGLGVLVLVLLIVGIGSALKAPSTHSTEQTAFCREEHRPVW